MTTPEHVAQWWDCQGEGSVCEIDLRPGGAWRFVNRTPKGQLVAFSGVYREIVPPERMVYTEIFEPFHDGESIVTAEFTEEGDKTRLTLTALYPSIDVRDLVLKSGMERGAAISYDRLEDIVVRLKARA